MKGPLTEICWGDNSFDIAFVFAFAQGGGEHFAGDRLGILIGSALSAVCAYAILHMALPKEAATP